MTDTTAFSSALQQNGLFRQDAYIDGNWVNTAQRFAVTDPATGNIVATVA
ncbi:succinate-semialdehyde dehydrogenase protein, partial [Alcanivorax xiamenensis]